MRLRHLALALALTGIAACGSDATGPDLFKVQFADSLHVDIRSMQAVGNGEYVQDLLVGAGDSVATGRTLTVFYTGWTSDGTKFDSNVGGNPFNFILGAGQVIKGWDEGLIGMRVGGKRRLVIPPSLGYGSAGSGRIPPNAVLVFDVQVTAQH
jgi:FKBP-type peptidyl-prolyl cis-trans isomerase